MYQQAKNEVFHWLVLEIWLIIKILQSGWLRAFWPISLEEKSSQIWDFCRNIANNIHFHYRIISVKINDKIFKYIKKNPVYSLFLAHLLDFLGKNSFSRKSGSVTHNFIWVSSIIPNLRKTNGTIPRKRQDRRKDGHKEGQTLFLRTLPTNVGGPKMCLTVSLLICWWDAMVN